MTTDLPICAKSADNGALMMFSFIGSGYCLPEFWEGRFTGTAAAASTIPNSQSGRQASASGHLTGRCIRSCICNPLRAIATLIVHAWPATETRSLHRDLLNRPGPVAWPGGRAADFPQRIGPPDGSAGNGGGQSTLAEAYVPIPKTDAQGITDQALRRNQRRHGGDDDCDQRPATHSAAATIRNGSPELAGRQSRTTAKEAGARERR